MFCSSKSEQWYHNIYSKDNSIEHLLLSSGKLHTVKIRVDYTGLEGEWSEAAVLTPTLTECCMRGTWP